MGKKVFKVEGSNLIACNNEDGGGFDERGEGVCGKDTFSASVRPDLGVSEAKRSV